MNKDLNSIVLIFDIIKCNTNVNIITRIGTEPMVNIILIITFTLL